MSAQYARTSSASARRDPRTSRTLLTRARLGDAEVVYDWAGGLLWMLAPEELDLRAAMAGVAGHATLVRASEAAKARHGFFHPEPAPLAAVAAGLRARFDPRGVLNRGRMAARAPLPSPAV